MAVGIGRTLETTWLSADAYGLDTAPALDPTTLRFNHWPGELYGSGERPGPTGRQHMMIGEAAGRVSEGLRAARPEIPWASVIVLRNVLAHEYGEIIVERIRVVVQKHIPKLALHLEALLPDPPG